MKKLPSQKLLRKWFVYRNKNLYWKKSSGPRAKINKAAGTITNRRYVMIKFLNNRYLAHRLIWVYHYGDIPEGLTVDHKDENKLNNDIENLQLLTHRINVIKSRRLKPSYSNYTGVSLSRSGKKWRARIWFEKEISLGFFDTELEAATAYQDALKKLK